MKKFDRGFAGLIRRAALGGLVFATAFACAREPVPASASDVLTIGVATALSGDLQVIGASQQNATRVAEAHINACGGILGKRVVFPIVDDETSVNGFRKALDQLFAQKPSALIGPTSSGQAIDGQDRIFQANLLQISASASTPTMTLAQPSHDRTFFRTTASHELQARALAILTTGGSTAIGMPKCTRAIIFHNDDDYGTPIARKVDEHMRARNGSVVLDVAIPPVVKGNYEAEAQTIVAKAIGAGGMATGADCQILVTFPPAGAAYMLAFKKAIESNTARDWSTFSTIGTNGVFQLPFIELSRTGPDPRSTRAEGVFGMQPESNPPGPAYDDFRRLYTAYFPNAASPLPAYTSNQFDAAILLALAMERAGTSTDTTKIREALFEVARPPGQAFGPGQLSEALAALRRNEDIDYQGASGDVDFDEFGDVSGDYILWKVEGGVFKTNENWRIRASELVGR